jgi:hypothetical protein
VALIGGNGLLIKRFAVKLLDSPGNPTGAGTAGWGNACTGVNPGRLVERKVSESLGILTLNLVASPQTKAHEFRRCILWSERNHELEMPAIGRFFVIIRQIKSLLIKRFTRFQTGRIKFPSLNYIE